jgi:hypothetical protein
MGELLALFGSGICAFLWLNTMASQGVALAGAVLYMLMPYHLAIDFYRRTALSECWALVWIPLVLYFSARSTKRRPVLFVGLAVAYAMLILSHLVSVFIISPVVLAAALALSPQGRKVESVLYTAAGMLLGTGLSCFYFLSALSHAKYFPVSRLPLWSYVEGHLLTAGKLFGAGFDGFIRLMSLTVLDMVALCVFCSVFALAKGHPMKKTVLFWLMICVIPVLLMHSRSAAVWHRCPPLFAAIQYPWRLNIVLCIAFLPIFAAFVSGTSGLRRVHRISLFVLLSVLLIPWLLSYGSIWRSYKGQTPRSFAKVDDDDGWFQAWTAPGLDQVSALRASTGPQVRFLASTGTATVLLWRPRHIEFQTNSAAGGHVIINQFYYRSWRALVHGNQAIEVMPKMPEGLIDVSVPPGPQQVKLEIPVGLAERIGQGISVLCILLSLAVICGPIRRYIAEARHRRSFAASCEGCLKAT